MKVFFSWSGSESRQVAEILAAWLRSVLQNVDTYISSQDIQKGERWGPSISGNLAEIDFGIVVLTKSNLNAPWVSFEAGALSKNVGLSRVIPILCDLTDSDLTKHPLSQFQYAKLDRGDLLDLVQAINAFAERKVPEALLAETFNLWWKKAEAEISAVKFVQSASQKTASVHNSSDERLEKLDLAVNEILHHIRRTRNSERLEAANAGRVMRDAERLYVINKKYREKDAESREAHEEEFRQKGRLSELFESERERELAELMRRANIIAGDSEKGKD